MVYFSSKCSLFCLTSGFCLETRGLFKFLCDLAYGSLSGLRLRYSRLLGYSLVFQLGISGDFFLFLFFCLQVGFFGFLRGLFRVRSLRRGLQFLYCVSIAGLLGGLLTYEERGEFGGSYAFEGTLSRVPGCYEGTVLLKFVFSRCPEDYLVGMFVTTFRRVRSFYGHVNGTRIYRLDVGYFEDVLCGYFRFYVCVFCGALVFCYSTRMFIYREGDSICGISGYVYGVEIRALCRRLPKGGAIVLR